MLCIACFKNQYSSRDNEGLHGVSGTSGYCITALLGKTFIWYCIGGYRLLNRALRTACCKRKTMINNNNNNNNNNMNY